MAAMKMTLARSGDPVCVSRVFRIVDVLSKRVVEGMRENEIVQQTGFRRQNVYRDLLLLTEAGAVTKDERGTYRLTSFFHRLAVRYEQQLAQAKRQLDNLSTNAVRAAL